MKKEVVFCLLVLFSFSTSLLAEQLIIPVQEKGILEFIQNNYPEKYNDILPLKEKFPEFYQKVLKDCLEIKQQREGA